MIILIIIFILFDLISKILISKCMNIGDSIIVINKFFNITYVKNTGAAWSILSNNTLLVLIISVLIISYIIYYIHKNKVNNKLEKYGYSLLLGGSISNLIDRIIHGYVIDYFDFTIFTYNYPIFNIADICIVIGVLLLVLDLWRNKDENTGR